MTIPNSIPKFLWHFIKRQKIGFFFLIFTSIIWSINEVFFPYFIKQIINTIYDYQGDPHAIYDAVKIPLLTLISIWLFMEVCMRTQGMTTIAVFPRFRANIREDVYNYVKQHSHDYFANNFAGAIAKKLSELPNSSQTIIEIICYNLTSFFVSFIIALTLMWKANPVFAGIFLVWFSLHMAFTLCFLKIGNTRWETHSEAVSVLSGKLVDSLTNMLNVRLFARGEHELEYIRTYQADEIKKSRKAMWTIEIMRLFQGTFAAGLIITMIISLVYGWSRGWVSLGDFSLIGMLTFSMLGMTWFISYQLTVFVRELGTIGEALSLTTKGHDIVDAPQAKPLVVNRGEIVFNDVTFSYQRNHPVFKQLNVLIHAGQRVGLVGFSGSGKTTFVNLILRAYDLDRGSIFIDGNNIADVTQNSLREQIAMIPQDPTLFHRSLMENIRYGRLNATDEEVIAAAKLAHCHDFIEKLPEGYAALVGERGIKLSGGQRQRIAIARAILKGAPILILDEATSSLDSVTEKLIQESLETLMQNRTTIVIAHRLSTLADMDRILVFDKGQIIEDGSKEELLKLKGHFAHLWEMQTDGFLPDKRICK